mmetsp:Transcript_23172/g.34870  ORF Transcript_23172/g.34870 Transcript_23172/m.34870 type:complete len:205 (+) Transcript_23172:29-643(+)
MAKTRQYPSPPGLNNSGRVVVIVNEGPHSPELPYVISQATKNPRKRPKWMRCLRFYSILQILMGTFWIVLISMDTDLLRLLALYAYTTGVLAVMAGLMSNTALAVYDTEDTNTCCLSKARFRVVFFVLLACKIALQSFGVFEFFLERANEGLGISKLGHCSRDYDLCDKHFMVILLTVGVFHIISLSLSLTLVVGWLAKQWRWL